MARPGKLTEPETTRPSVMMPLSEIKPDPRNAKEHDIAGLGDSFERFGLVELMTLDERTGQLISGHGRLERLETDKAAGSAPPKDVVVRDDGEWLVPVVRGWSSADDGEAEAALAAVNRLVESGGWKPEKLADALERISAGPRGLAGVGFKPADLSDLLAGIGRNSEPSGRYKRRKLGPDELPPTPPPATTKEGDIWILGDHRVMCGNGGNREQVERLLGGDNKADCILTDPPYCSGGFQEAGRAQGSIGTVRQSGLPTIANDRLSTRGYQALMRSVLSVVSAPVLYCFTDWRQWVNLFDIVESLGFGVRNMVVWDKGSPGMGMGWRTQHELVMFAASSTVKFDNHKAQGNVIATKRTGNLLHPTQKPVELLVRILEVTDMARTIYDPFAGSGSTLIACHAAGRAARLMELGPAYVDVICKRWEGVTGELPMLEATGERRSFLGPEDG